MPYWWVGSSSPPFVGGGRGAQGRDRSMADGLAGRNPEERDPLEVIIGMYLNTEVAPNVADQVRAQPAEGVAFAIGASSGAISNARRLFADREWTTAELMRMERDMNECINWAEAFRSMIRQREGK